MLKLVKSEHLPGTPWNDQVKPNILGFTSHIRMNSRDPEDENSFPEPKAILCQLKLIQIQMSSSEAKAYV